MPHNEVWRISSRSSKGDLGWMTEYADRDGDGLLEYVDQTGHGLANQGWKDSGDAVQWPR